MPRLDKEAHAATVYPGDACIQIRIDKGYGIYTRAEALWLLDRLNDWLDKQKSGCRDDGAWRL